MQKKILDLAAGILIQTDGTPVYDDQSDSEIMTNEADRKGATMKELIESPEFILCPPVWAEIY